MVHLVPSPIRIRGMDLQKEFGPNGDVSVEVFDAIARLMQQQETTLYQNLTVRHQRWRHYMPEDLVVN